MAGKVERPTRFPPVAPLFQRQIVDETASASELRHLLRLVWRRVEAVGIGFTFDHVTYIRWPMADDNTYRTGRHCIFALHVHLVFVAKYRRRVFTEPSLADLRTIFASVCNDFETE